MYFGCEHCIFKTFDKEKAEKHTKDCYLIPKNKGCATCANLDGLCTKGHNAKLEVTDIKCPDWALNKKIPPMAVYITD